MKKEFVFFLLGVLLTTSCSVKIGKSYLEIENLKGKVKSCRQRVFTAASENGEIVKLKEQSGDFLGNELHEFNKKGYRTKYYMCYLGERCDQFPETFKFNKKGLLEKSNTFYPNSGDVKNGYRYFYKDSADVIIVRKESILEKTKMYFIKYDKNKNLIFDGNKYSYDNQNNLVKEVNFIGTINYLYDSNHNKIQRIYHTSYSVIKSEFSYITFDKNGNWIKQIEFRDGIPRFITERTILYY